MVMITQSPRTGQYIKKELGSLSRDKLTFSGGEFWPGEVYALVSGLAVKLTEDAEDGSETAAGICYAHVDASEEDKEGVASTRLTEVNYSELTWPDEASDTFIASCVTNLAEQHLVVRGA